MPRQRVVFAVHRYSKNKFTVKNLEDFLGGKLNLKRAMRWTRVRPTQGGYFTELDARKLIVAHLGGLHDLMTKGRDL